MEGHQWYVIQVMSGQEKKVKHSIEESRQAAGMTEYIEEVLVPSENVAEVKRGEQKISEKRLWPGYALVKMKLTDDSWQYIKGTNGVIDFMGATTRNLAMNFIGIRREGDMEVLHREGATMVLQDFSNQTLFLQAILTATPPKNDF